MLGGCFGAAGTGGAPSAGFEQEQLHPVEFPGSMRHMPADTATDEDSPSKPRSTAYKEFLADREDLLRHKWLMSERAGRDVGLEAALLDWVDHFRSPMRKQRK